MKVVYIASPYTVGDTAKNVKLQIDAANELIDMGYCPIWPLSSHFLHMAAPKTQATWIDLDIELLSRADCVLRLGGFSEGADGEVAYAIQNDMPVFNSVEELDSGEMG